MGRNILVINVDIRETRVALIENGIIAELHLERESSKGTLGNIYLGKVSRVLPGMQAAFIDVGLERAAFLHVEDLIRPDDFEAYLQGHRRGSEEERETRSSDEEARVPEVKDRRPAEPEARAAVAAADEEDDDARPILAGRDAEDLAPIADDPVADEVAEAVESDADSVYSAASEVLAHEAELEDAPPDESLDEAPDEGVEAAADDFDDEASEHEPAPEGDADDEPEGDEPLAAAEAPEADDEGDEPEAGDLEAEAADEGEGSPVEAVADAGDEPLAEAVLAEAVAGDAAVADVPEGDIPITVAQQQRRRRGGRRDRVRRSRSTRDRLPETAAAQPAARAAGAEAPPQATPRSPQQGNLRSDATGRGRGGQGGRGEGDRGRRDGRRDGRNEGGGRDGRRGQGAQAQQGAPEHGRRDGRRDGRKDGRRDGRPDNRGDRGDRGGARGRNQEPPRISKTTPIREVVREGQEVLVQISKEPIGTKGARVTSHISLPGRYVVYLPTVDHIGISKRIGSEKERQRLREAIESMKPPQGGLIVRTVAEGLTKKQLKADVGYLVRLWGEVVKKRESGMRAPNCLYTEVDLVLKTARDLFTDDIEKIVIDDREEYFRLKKFIEMFMPERIDAIELYEGEEPIFDAYGIEDEIQRALARKVPLPSGGYLIIDQAEALTAIDVNTGRFVGKGSKDLEETILATNLEAVEEIAYQLRFRNIGGLIILDLIDMDRPQNREKVRRRMEELLSKDKAKTTLNRISELGLIEMTRKRTRESLGRTILEPCFYCDGTGQLQSKQTIAYEILRQIRRERQNLPGYVIIVNAHPAIIDLLKNDERDAVLEGERIFQRRIELVPRKEYHLEQFDLQGK